MTYQELTEHFRTQDRYETPKEMIGSRFLNTTRFYHWFARQVIGCGVGAMVGFEFGQVSRGSYRMLRAVERCGGTVTIEGLDNVRKLTRPPVIISNHMSTLETVLMPILFSASYPVTYILKKSLLSYPFLGQCLKGLQCVGVGRENPKEDLQTAIKGGAAALASGRALVIFPQSTRSVIFDPRKFNTLGMRIAREAGAPVIPVCLKTDMWKNGKLVKDLGPIDVSIPVRVEIGAPFDVENLKQDHEKVVTFIQERLERWGHPTKEDGISADNA